MFPKVLEVAADGSKDFRSIQNAISYAEVFEREFQQSCRVVVSPGVYFENLSIRTRVRVEKRGTTKTSTSSSNNGNDDSSEADDDSHEPQPPSTLAGEVVIAGARTTSASHLSSSRKSSERRGHARMWAPPQGSPVISPKKGRSRNSKTRSRKKKKKKRKSRNVATVANRDPQPSAAVAASRLKFRVGAVVRVRMGDDVWGPIPPRHVVGATAASGNNAGGGDVGDAGDGGDDDNEGGDDGNVVFVDAAAVGQQTGEGREVQVTLRERPGADRQESAHTTDSHQDDADAAHNDDSTVLHASDQGQPTATATTQSDQLEDPEGEAPQRQQDIIESEENQPQEQQQQQQQQQQQPQQKEEEEEQLSLIHI